MKRKWITLSRVFQYGVYNFRRNAWLTTAATVVMTVTLLIIVTSFTLRLVFADTISVIRERIDVSIYLKDDITSSERQKLETALRKLPIVTDIQYISKQEAQAKFRDQNSADTQQLEALNQLEELKNNPLPASLRVKTNDPNRLKEISDLALSREYKGLLPPDLPPSNSGERRQAIERIADWSKTFETASFVASIVFVVLSVLIIFNTIRMAIYNRREEIQMMRLIGANPRFIRGPFIVEAVLYGVFAAIISSLIVYAIIISQPAWLMRGTSQGIQLERTISFYSHWPIVVVLGLILIGAAIGYLSSSLAIRRYLRDGR